MVIQANEIHENPGWFTTQQTSPKRRQHSKSWRREDLGHLQLWEAPYRLLRMWMAWSWWKTLSKPPFHSQLSQTIWRLDEGKWKPKGYCRKIQITKQLGFRWRAIRKIKWLISAGNGNLIEPRFRATNKDRNLNLQSERKWCRAWGGW